MYINLVQFSRPMFWLHPIDPHAFIITPIRSQPVLQAYVQNSESKTTVYNFNKVHKFCVIHFKAQIFFLCAYIFNRIAAALYCTVL